MEHPLYRPLREILQYANPNQQEVIAEAAEELNRLTAPLPAEIEEIAERHDAHDRDGLGAFFADTECQEQAHNDRGILLDALRASEARAAAAYEDAAKIADMYAETNMEQMGDSILLDPLLSGGGFTDENIRRSQNLAVDGCVHSSMFHAAQNIAAAIRAKANGGK